MIASHIPVLVQAAAQLTPRAVLELGSGAISTPLFLSRGVFADLTRLVSIEDDPDWQRRALAYRDARHDVRLVGRVADYLTAQDSAFWEEFDLIFVDDSFGVKNRVDSIRAVVVARPPGVVLIHDFEVFAYRSAAGFPFVRVADGSYPLTGLCSFTPHPWISR